VQPDRVARLKTLAEVVACQELLHREVTRQVYNLPKSSLDSHYVVVAYLGAAAVQYAKGLVRVGFALTEASSNVCCLRRLSLSLGSQ